MSFIFAVPTIANAADNCLGFDAVGQEYPAVRDKLIAEGWAPKYLAPPFEGAPFAEWVKIRNYAEVEACAPTGRANCKFTFTSRSSGGLELSILTEGEEIGIVTEHECSRYDDAALDSGHRTPGQRPGEINKRWVRQSASDFYVAKTFNYEKLFDFRLHCMADSADRKFNSVFLIIGQDVGRGNAEFLFENGASYTFAIDDNGYSVIRGDELSNRFNQFVSNLKAENSVTINFRDETPFIVSLAGSSKAIGQCSASAFDSSAIANNQLSVIQNENGFRITNQFGKPLFLGRSCDAFNEALGGGTWCQNQGRVDLSFGRGDTTIPNFSLPASSSQQTQNLPCPCVSTQASAPPLDQEAASAVSQTLIDFDLVVSTAQKVQQRILTAEQETFNLLSQSHVFGPIKELVTTGAFADLVSASTPFAACLADDVQVFGFYHVGQHLWTLARYDRINGELVGINLSRGFKASDESDRGLAWFAYNDVKLSISERLVRATREQLDFFGELFPTETCEKKFSEIAILEGSAALNDLVANHTHMFEDSARVLRLSEQKLQMAYGAQEKLELVPMLAVKLGSGNYLTGFISKDNPTVVLVQRVSLEDDSLTVLASGASNILWNR